MRRGNMRRQVELYTPGCGRLRKTERSENTEQTSTKQTRFRREGSAEDESNKSEASNIEAMQRRSRRPEQKLFVPTVVAKARESEQKAQHHHHHQQQHQQQQLHQQQHQQQQQRHDGNKNEWNLNGNNNKSNERIAAGRSKRYSNRRTNDVPELRDEWRGGSPNRNFRQGSEPRSQHISGGGGGSWSRARDTRSVEPQVNTSNKNNYPGEKSHMKPPSGRRHSTIGMEPDKRPKFAPNMDHVPPRFRKKYYDEKQQAGNYNNTNQPEDSWDGSSITFQGSSSHHVYHQKPQYNCVSNQHVTSNNTTYYTLPSRPRGRGRLHQDCGNVPGMYRSMTPDKIFANSPVNSRPGTPDYGSRAKSNESLNRDSRPHTPVNNDRFNRGFNNRRNEDVYVNNNRDSNREKPFRESLKAQTSPISPPTPEEKLKIDLVPVNNDVLDWGEEVEQHSKHLDAEVYSDVITRSSSMASLMETSTKSLPSTTRPNKHKKKKNKRNKRGANSRDRSADNSVTDDYSRTNQHRQRHNSQNSVESRENFKVPGRRRKNSQDNRTNSYDSRNRSKNNSRDSSFDRARKSSCSEQENWREEILRKKHPSDVTIKKNVDVEHEAPNKGGILHLPQATKAPVLSERPKLPASARRTSVQKSLYDPNNPGTPIIVNKPNTRVNCPGFSENTEAPPPQLYTTDQYGNIRPSWHNEQTESWKTCHYPNLLKEIRQADNELQSIINSGRLLICWSNVIVLRSFLMESLEYLLCMDLKFSQLENIDQYFWRILYYNIIEMMRKAITNDPEHKEQYKTFLLNLIDEGTVFYEKLLDTLETKHNFKLVNYLGSNSHQKAGGYINMALNSAQKIFIYLGDLGRYREQVNETSNYGKCRQMYVKAHEINPKHGRPYNQLAVLAVYSKKKLDAVYYYMRSLMSNNPVQSAKECLISLFDENRKKYEHGERKRREERLERARLHMKEKESQNPKNKHGSLRKETWIRPDGGRRVHRTTSTLQDTKAIDSEEEDLAALTSVEVNKRFVTSYLHVHGKLITKIGMETFHETALQMLKEFRALLQHSPVPLPSTRFLQLLALNMFAIETTQLKDPVLQSGYRSELQERALVVSLQMFSLILEKCVALLNEHIKSNPDNMNAIPPDCHELLPSVKIWCDWMLCHSTIWNPPPSTQDFKVGPPGDAWSRLATLMNLLEKLDQSVAKAFATDAKEGFEQVRLPEDAALSGFMPLIYNDQNPTYVPRDVDMEAAQFVVRIKNLIFFGTIFLCGLDPPVLKLKYQDDCGEYVSVVCTTANRSSPSTPPEFNESELLLESFSEDEGISEQSPRLVENAPSEIQELLNRKVELEKCHRDQELHRQTVQKILQQSVVSVHIEVRPKNLVPDTNCFIDYLAMLKKIASSGVYTLTVPLIVLNELEGLAKGSKSPSVSPRNNDPHHAVKVAECAKYALEFLSNRHPCVKCITTKGTILTSTTFTKEDDTLVDANMTNDDRILATCMTLCKGNSEQIIGEPRKLHRELVLLTEDRNLRVKALARDVPVREVPSFLQWAGLG